MNIIRDIKGYATSRDYAQLVTLMQTQSVVCTVRYGSRIDSPMRDVAHTFFEAESHSFAIRARGMEYVGAHTAADFIRECLAEEVEFLVPNTTR